MTIKAESISKRYFRKTGGANYFYAVHPLNLEIRAGEMAVLTGRSGSGKTTLLNLLSGLLPPTEGKIRVNETDLYSLNDKALSRLRSVTFGVVPQGRSAIDTLTVMENILLPAKLYGLPLSTAEAWLERLASRTCGMPGPPNCLAASCGVWPLPGRWRRVRISCLPTSLPATWTTKTPAWYCPRSVITPTGSKKPSSWSPTKTTLCGMPTLFIRWTAARLSFLRDRQNKRIPSATIDNTKI